MKFKESELAQERSRINKINAAKKEWHHKLGPCGYEVAPPKWDLVEQQMVDAGVTPVTLSWPSRCMTWFYAHGRALDPKACEVLEWARSRCKFTCCNRKCLNEGVHAQQRERRAYPRHEESWTPGKNTRQRRCSMV